MKERPILFSGAMVRAILDGRKTQTRRIIKPQPMSYYAMHCFNLFLRWKDIDAKELPATMFIALRCRYGKPGDRLWVREAFTVNTAGEVLYLADWKADGSEWEGMGWKPSIHMPRWASRIMLEVSGVRVERVWDISAQDIAAEGTPGMICERYQCQRCNGQGYSLSYPTCPHCNGTGDSPTRYFKELWNGLNSRRGYGWDTNPWVWVIEFRRV